MFQSALPDPAVGATDPERTDPVSDASAGGLGANIGRWPLYPILFAAYPILSLFALNADQVRSSELVWPLIWACTIALAIVSALTYALRDSKRAALITALIVIACFTLDRTTAVVQGLVDRFDHLWVHSVYVVKPQWVLIPELAIVAVLCVLIARKLKAAAAITTFFNLMAVLLLSFPVTQSLAVKMQNVGRSKYVPTPYAIDRANVGTKPDIYYIILDGYARSDIMKSLFRFDNSTFLERLEKKGFYVASRSIANYCQTPLCLSSSMNLRYIDKLVHGLNHDQTELSDFIGNNNLLATLRPLGYKFVTFATGFDPTEHPEADQYLGPYPHSTGFERMVIDETPLQLLWPDPKRFRQSQLQRERILYLLDRLPAIANDPAPTITFAHILCPHLPFVFGENGEDTNLRYTNFRLIDNERANGRFTNPERFIEGYRRQSVFITTRIEQTIDRILAASTEPPIIILQSDHGSELYLDRNDVRHTDLKERMSILNAYYFPGKKYEALYETISPVNSFRVVLNAFFGGSIPLLADQSFFSTWQEPYEFVDVTKSVKEAAAP